MKKKPTLYLMVGLPGSGKSTYANSLVEQNSNAVVISRDVIRYSVLTDKDTYFEKEFEVFNEFIRQIQENLLNSKDVYADATHLNWGSRNKLLKNFFGPKFKNKILVKAIVINTPYEICLERNEKRAGRACVPPQVIESMQQKLTNPASDPFKYDQIIIKNWP